MMAMFAEELLLNIVQHLDFEQSFRLDINTAEEEEGKTARQHENHTRQQALYSLCLKSHQLRRLALPILYSCFAGTTTRHGLLSLELFHRTFSSELPFGDTCGSSRIDCRIIEVRAL
jgi:hypothetical protein